MGHAPVLTMLALVSGCHLVLPLGPGSSQDQAALDVSADGMPTPEGPGLDNAPLDVTEVGGPRDGQLDSGQPGCATLLAGQGNLQLWSSDFDSDPVDTYPTGGWTVFWNGSANNTKVVDTRAHSLPHSFQLESVAAWARWDGKPINAATMTGNLACYEAWVWVEPQQPQQVGYIGFAWKQTATTSGEYAGILVSIPGTWVRVMYHVDLGTDTCTRYVSGEAPLSVGCGTATAHQQFTHFVIGTQGGNGRAYFDDVNLYWVE